MSEQSQRREQLHQDQGNWAKPVDKLVPSNVPHGAQDTVGGKQTLSPIQGFGKMWQKTYSVTLQGADVSPQELIAVWKAEFPTFWPRSGSFYAPLTGIAPGEVALLDAPIGGGFKLSTGVFVLYADEESFTFMTPQGHVFAGWITFSASRQGDGPTVAQAQVLMRAQDPITEIGLTLIGHRKEDAFWLATLRSLATRFGVDAAPERKTVCVDRRRQWSRAGNVRHNVGLRAPIRTVTSPLRRGSRDSG
jgi:hypothetical protein